MHKMRRTQSLKNYPHKSSSLEPVDEAGVTKRFSGLKCGGRGSSSDITKPLPQASKDYLAALRDVVSDSEDDCEEQEERSKTPQVQDQISKKTGQPQDPNLKFISKTAEKICQRKLKTPYPKYMNSLHQRTNSSDSEDKSQSNSPAPSLSNLSASPKDKHVSWGNVFTQDKVGSNPQLSSSAIDDEVPRSPPLLRRAVSAKTRRHKKIH